MPAASPMMNQWCCSSQPSMSGVFQLPIFPPARNGTLNVGIGYFCCGDLLMPPPAFPPGLSLA